MSISNKKLFESLNLSRFTQIGVVVKDIDETTRYYEKSLGLGPFVKPRVNFFNIFYYKEKVDSDWLLAFCYIGEIEMELIQPITEPTIYHDFLKTNGEGIHHLGFDVNNIETKINICKDFGIDIIQRGERKGGKFAYLDTWKIGGIVIELIQRDSKLSEKFFKQ